MNENTQQFLQDSKVISPEIKGLFETIRLQAKEYIEAFEYFKKEQKISEQLQSELTNIINEFHNKSNNLFSEINQNVNDTLGIIESKNERIIKIFDELDNIKNLRDSIQLLYDSIHRHSLEQQNTVANLISKTESELRSAITEIRIKNDKEIESQLSRIELRLALRLKNFENKLILLEGNLLTLNETQARQYESFIDENDLIKIRISDFRQSVDEVKKYFDKALTESEEKMNNKIDGINLVISDYNSPSQFVNIKSEYQEPTKITLKKVEQQEVTPEFQKDYSEEIKLNEENKLTEEIKSFDNKINKLSLKIESSEKKQSTAMIIAIISLIGFILMLLIKFI